MLLEYSVLSAKIHKIIVGQKPIYYTSELIE